MNVIAAILLHLNPLTLPVSLLISALLKAAVGKDADPAYRAPEDTDDADIQTILRFFKSGQPSGQRSEYLLACNRLGANYKQPFAPDHPYYGATYHEPF